MSIISTGDRGSTSQISRGDCIFFKITEGDLFCRRRYAILFKTGQASNHPHGEVLELADSLDLGSSAARRGGSNPPFPTICDFISDWSR